MTDAAQAVVGTSFAPKMLVPVSVGRTTVYVPGGTAGYPAHPRLIRLSVSLSVSKLLIFLRIIALAQQIW